MKLAEGVVEALEAVSRAGLRQVIASALRNDLLKAQVSSFGIAEYFSEVLQCKSEVYGRNDYRYFILSSYTVCVRD